MTAGSPIEISWCSDANEAPKLGRFFADNITSAYISHSELQGPRARDASHWSPGLLETLTHELEERIRPVRENIATTENIQPVFAARRMGDLIGLGLVSFFPRAPVPYAILEDLVVAMKERNLGIGKQLLDWVMREAKSHGCVRVFLESGVQNHRAHEFFEREGFSVCSVVMMKGIGST